MAKAKKPTGGTKKVQGRAPAEAPHAAGVTEALQKLSRERQSGGLRIGSRLRNYFTTGILIVGPLTITLYIIWTVVNLIDAWVKPLLPQSYLPGTYLPFAIPGIGLIFAVIAVTIVGALAANLLGRTLISFGELMLDRMPIVRNVYRAIKQLFEGILTATASEQAFQKVGVIQFPSKGIWAIVFVTNEAAGEIASALPGDDDDLLTVFMPTGVVPPTGFICFVPRADVTLLEMSAEDAAKIIVSGGMVIPQHEKRFTDLTEDAVHKRKTKRVVDLTTGKADPH